MLKNTLLALLILPALPAHAFLFWLDAPSGRTNPHDPKSPNYAQNQPVYTPYAWPTKTPTASPSPAYSPTSSPTVSATFSASPSFTTTPTVAPTHGALVMDFENNAGNDKSLWNSGAVYVVKDSLGSTISPDPWTATSGAAGGAYGRSAFDGCISGTLPAQNGIAGFFPFTFISFDLVPNGGKTLAQGGADTNVLAYSPGRGLQFDYKAGAAGVLYEVELISTSITDYGYYRWQFTPADTAWHTAVVYFPDVLGPIDAFWQPVWGAFKPWDGSKVGSLLFKPVARDGVPVAYDLCLDNLSFAVPTPVPTPTVGACTMIMDFNSPGSDNLTLAPFSQGISTYHDPNGSTLNPYPWTASSATGLAGCISGVMTQQLPSASPPVYPACSLEFLLAPSGWPSGGGFVDIRPYAPNKRLVFDYKAGSTATRYTVQIVTANITDYGFYEYSFSAPDTAWHSLAVNFPDASWGPKFSQPSWGTPRAWDPSLAGDIIFKVVPSNAGPVPFDLCIDNLRFN